jgi:drug/metabolite transporter (DMT)-like permease
VAGARPAAAGAASDLIGRPVLTAAVGALLIAFSAILVRLADVEPATAAVFRCLYAAPVLLLLAHREDRRLGPRSHRSRLLAAAAGVFFAADLVFWHYAIEDVGAGLATVLANLQVVLVAVVAWLVLAERPSTGTLLGLPLALAGVVLISGVVGAGAYGAHPGRGVVFGLLTALAYTGFLLALRQANDGALRPSGPLADATVVSAVVAAAAGVAVGELTVTPSFPAHGWLALLALTSQVLGWLLIASSLPRLPAIGTALILTVQPLGTLLLGVALLDESPSTGQVVGALVLLAGVVVAQVGRRPAPAAV